MSTAAATPQRPRSNPWRQDQKPTPVLTPVPNGKIDDRSTMPIPSTSSDDDDTFVISTGRGRSPDVDPGVYALVLHEVKQETGPNRWDPAKGDTKSYVWSFRLATDPEASEGVFLFFTGTSAKSQKLQTVLTAFGLSGAPTFSRRALLGKSVQGMVEMSDRGYPRLVNIFPPLR